MSKEDYVDMKIKEKGLTGKSAAARRDDSSNRKGFNAFREMRLANGKGKEGKKGEDKEVWLQFMGNKVRVLEEEGGTVKEEDVPRTKGATLKFSGCGGEASFDDIKVRPFHDQFTLFNSVPHYAETAPSRAACRNRSKSAFLAHPS